jgi:hypothetical protein
VFDTFDGLPVHALVLHADRGPAAADVLVTILRRLVPRWRVAPRRSSTR